MSIDLTHPMPDALERARREIDAVASCTVAGSTCVVEVVPGVDEVGLTHALRERGTVWSLCHTNCSVNVLGGEGPSALVDRAVAWAMAMPFAPEQRWRARLLRSEGPSTLLRAARDVGWSDPLLQTDITKLASAVYRASNAARQHVPAAVQRRFWVLAALFDRQVIDRWIQELIKFPEPLLESARSMGVGTILFPDGTVMRDAERALAVTLAQRAMRVVVLEDPRCAPTDGWSAGLEEEVHRHRLDVSVTSSHSVLDVLQATARARRHPTAMTSTAPEGFPATADVYGTREQLFGALAAGLVNLDGVTPLDSASGPLAAVEPCMFGIDTLAGRSMLLVTPRLDESIEVARQLGNYVHPRPSILGDGPLWRSKIGFICRVLDPCGRASGTDRDEAAAAVASVGRLLEWSAHRDFGSRLPREVRDLVFSRVEPDKTSISGSSRLAHEEAAYEAAVTETRTMLEALGQSSSSAEVWEWARHLCDVFDRHLTLLERNDTKALIDLAHELGDLRATGFEQAASGSQRWVVRAAQARQNNEARLAAAEALDRMLRGRPRALSQVIAVPGEGRLYVTHIQRTGLERADHIVICRTLHRHMPLTAFVGANGLPRSVASRAPDPGYEAALCYRAMRGAMRSVHMLSVDQSPWLAAFGAARDHGS